MPIRVRVVVLALESNLIPPPPPHFQLVFKKNNTLVLVYVLVLTSCP